MHTRCLQTSVSDRLHAMSVQLRSAKKLFDEFGDLSDATVCGQGTFGKVVFTRSQVTQRLVALKFPRTWRNETHATAEHFDVLAEASYMTAMAKSPHCVKLLDCYRQPQGLPVLSTEVWDMSLLDWLSRRGAVPDDVSKMLMSQLCCGVGHMHAAAIVHNDLKPGNLLLKFDMSMRLAIADFGTAVTVPPRGRFCTRMLAKGGLATMLFTLSCRRGTPCYAAPETVDGKFGCSADVWTVAVIWCELLLGHRVSGADTSENALGDFHVFLDASAPADHPSLHCLPATPDVKEVAERGGVRTYVRMCARTYVARTQSSGKVECAHASAIHQCGPCTRKTVPCGRVRVR